MCVLVFGFFFGVQGYMQYAPMDAAPSVNYQGGAEKVVAKDGHVRGQPVDYAIMCGYFLAILAVGTWFGRRQKTTKDFFFGGQRFSWWLIAFSLIATDNRVVQFRQIQQRRLHVWIGKQSNLHERLALVSANRLRMVAHFILLPGHIDSGVFRPAVRQGSSRVGDDLHPDLSCRICGR